jgi:(1->4)-alpha-D-glucan 1-alpha-D-glucosylmutase
VKLGLGPTYRLQLRPDFGFREAAAVVPYLSELGVEVVWLSPVAEAVPASPTGREVVDPTRLRHELGSWTDLEFLVQRLEQRGLGLMVDIVSHHLSTYPGGRLWNDVLRHGRESQYADLFDIDWQAGRSGEDEKVALPVLDRPLRDILEAGALSFTMTGEGPVIRYGVVDLPVSGSFDAGADPADVLENQHYALVSRRDPRACNVRRLLEPEELVRLRVEDEDVFRRTHILLAELAGQNWLSAVCVDRVDALLDPGAYLRRLADLLGDMPIVVDKVLTGDEQLAHDWPVEGSIGYEAIDDISGALIDADGLERLASAAAREGERSVEVVVRSARRAAVEDRFPGETTRVARLLEVPESEVRERVVRTSVYRTYPSATEATLGAATRVALGAEPATAGTELGQLHFEALTAAVAKKAVEDMAYNRLVGRIPFCEIGGDPARVRADGAGRLVARAEDRSNDHQTGLVTGTRTVNKRSADARARLIAIAEMPDAFEAGIVRLGQLVSSWSMPDGTRVPDASELRYIAATILSIAPLESDGWRDVDRRLALTLRHIARASERRTSWFDPHRAYEDALISAAEEISARRGTMLRKAFGDLVDEVARLGAVTSLAQVVLRAFLPGVPDCFQGDESFVFALGGPDAQRAPNYDDLAGSLASLTSRRTGDEPASLRRSWRDGRVKMLATRQALRARRAVPRAFAPGAAVFSLPASGSMASHVFTFGRSSEGAVETAAPETGLSGAAERPSFALAVVTRRPRALPAERDDLPVGAKAWRDTVLLFPSSAPSVLVDAITGHTHSLDASPTDDEPSILPVGDVLSELPVAILVGRN